VGPTTDGGPSAKSSGSLEIGDRKIVFEYQFRADPARKAAPIETLTLDGKPVDLDQGRVVLVDLSPNGGTCKQVRVDLPESPTHPREIEQIESQAKAMLKHLRQQSKTVREFVD
jgi:hypothetical protein